MSRSSLTPHYPEGNLTEEVPDSPGEFYCPECGRKCTRGPSGTEYGHRRARRREERCSRRPESVDPDKPGSWGVADDE